MGLIYIGTKEKNLPDSGSASIHKFGTGAGEQRIALEGSWETDPHVYDFFIDDVEFYFFTKKDLLNYISSIDEEIHYPTQTYKCKDYPSFYSEKKSQIESLPKEMFILHFEKNPRPGGTSYLRIGDSSESNLYNNIFREVCLSSSKPGKSNAYTTYKFIKFQDTKTKKYYINLVPVFSKTYSMKELADILKREFAATDDPHLTIYLFGLKYAEQIINNNYEISEIIDAAEIDEANYIEELSNAIEIFKYLKDNRITINPIEERLSMLGAYLEEESVEEVYDAGEVEQIIYYGAPGTGKSFNIDKYLSDKHVGDNQTKRVIFYPDYSYSDFIGSLQPVDEKGTPTYKFVQGPFVELLKDAVDNSNKQYYMIIEEINRGNPAAIFGDIFQLLDRNKTGQSKYTITNKEISKYVYGNETTRVSLPNNLNILCTMNTADQNVFVLDTAFKRRFQMKYVKIDFSKLCETDDSTKGYCEETSVFAGAKDLSEIFKNTDLNTYVDVLDGKRNWANFAKLVNAKIDLINESGDSISEDKKLGPFFVSVDEINDRAKFADKVLYYLKQDVFKYSDTVLKPSYEVLYDRFVNNSDADIFEILASAE